NDFGRRIDAAAMPAARKQAALDFLRLYVAYKYGAQPAPAGLHAALKRLLTKLR
ncbi:MAG: Transglutaminase, partial [Massilia sp.]|nr:Transglutaminase [Massilia sp.]